MQDMPVVDCDLVMAGDLAERYLLGELAASEQEAYERHYFECSRCFEDLRLLQAVQVELRESKTAPAAAKALAGRPAQRPLWLWLWGTAVAAGLAGIAVVTMLSRSPEQVAGLPSSQSESATARAAPGATGLQQADDSNDVGTGKAARTETAPATQPRAVPTASHTAAVLHRLARVEAPRYTPRVFRGMHDGATQAFEAGMLSYLQGDYPAAVIELQESARLDPDRPDVGFYLGATQLVLGNTEAAARELQRTVDMGDTPFVAPAAFYLAKAQLKAGDVEAARQNFRRVLTYDTDLHAETATILRELDAIENAPGAHDTHR